MSKTNHPFASFLIIGSTTFFLGMLFASLPYDYYILWSAPPGADSPFPSDRAFYYDVLETHLKFMHASPPLIVRMLLIMIALGIIGLLTKLWQPSEANMLFDGASLVLYMCGVVVYASNIVKGLRVVSKGEYGAEGAQGMDAQLKSKKGDNILQRGGVQIQGREDTLKVLAASNTILALILIGVLVLQAGQWYALKKEESEMEEMDRVAAEKSAKKREAAAASSEGKKSQ